MIVVGDCVEQMRSLSAASIDAVVTDPPYGLEFMGKEWDKIGADGFRRSENPADVSRDDVFGRTSARSPEYRAGSAMQAWHEEWAAEALRVLKPGGHLLAFGGTRTYHRLASAVEDSGFEIRDMLAWMYGQGFPKSKNLDGDWQGWGTALKPAHEPVVFARKTLIGTVVKNVLQHGTGALNIDGCRIGNGDGRGRDGEASAERRYADSGSTNFAPTPGPRGGDSRGRWPANVMLDEEAAAMLDEQTGVLTSGKSDGFVGPHAANVYGTYARNEIRPEVIYGDSSGASRFFYCAKASKRERNAGTDKNTHPTVKPIAVMRWLVRLVTPPGGVVLDPFLGSGTTGIAAGLEGFGFIGIERKPDYAAIAEARIAHWEAA